MINIHEFTWKCIPKQSGEASELKLFTYSHNPHAPTGNLASQKYSALNIHILGLRCAKSTTMLNLFLNHFPILQMNTSLT